MFIRKNS